MLDIKFLRNNLDLVSDRLKTKGFVFDSETFSALDAQRKQADVTSQSLQAERKQASKKVGQLISQGKTVDEAKAEVAETLNIIDAQLSDSVHEAKAIQADIDSMLLATPNIPCESVPEGQSENDNLELARWGTPREFDFEPKDHVDIGEGLGLLSQELGAKIAGSRFTVLQAGLARMHRALTQFMIDTHTTRHGYREVYVPYIVNAESLQGTGQLPKFAEDLFRLDTEQAFYLTPTAEVPVTNLLRDVIIDYSEVESGLRFVCHTPCFRSEAGASGRDTRGMIRQHQFEKVELVQIVRPDDSEAALETLTSHAEAILQALELPYRKVALCGGDLGFSAQKTYDLEVWLPGQSAYREISSCSNFGDYQARRLQARWRNPETGKPELVHTLNGSGLAVGRTLVAILENYQQADGSVSIPTALQAYMGGLTKIG